MSNQLSAHFRKFGMGRKTSQNTPSPPPAPAAQAQPSQAHQQTAARPPSYPPPYQAPPGAHVAGRPTSPMPPHNPYGPGQIGGVPPPMGGAPMGAPMGGGGYGHPPGYGAPPIGGHRNSGSSTSMHMGGRPPAEVEGTNRSKAQLIVGIDFVSGLMDVASVGSG